MIQRDEERATFPGQGTPESFDRWFGKPIVEPSGLRIGTVIEVRTDGTGGAWVTLRAEWGVLDWLPALGGGSEPRFTFHSDALEEKENQLVLKHPAPELEKHPTPDLEHEEHGP